MAVVHFHDGRKEIVSPEVGASIWKVLNGEIEPTKEQVKFCAQVTRVFLNWSNAPDSYIEKHLAVIASQIVGSWMVAYGVGGGSIRPTRPEPSDTEMIAFCERWGLTVNGYASQLATKYF